jgi:hypothetical protein
MCTHTSLQVLIGEAGDSESFSSSGVLLLSADASAVLLRTMVSEPNKSSVMTDSLHQAWVREEALAGITSVDFVDTAAAVGRAVDHHTPSYSDRLKLHWEEVKSSFASGLTLLSGKYSYYVILSVVVLC